MSFERLLQPCSIAVFGGSAAQELVRQCDLMGYEGDIWPVNPGRSEILGRKTYRSVNELPGNPDAAYIAVNRNATIDIADVADTQRRIGVRVRRDVAFHGTVNMAATAKVQITIQLAV